MENMPDLEWGQFLAAITAVGALGTAAFGVVEALGKFITISWPPKFYFGLPYTGFGAVRKLTRPLKAALNTAYGADFLIIIAQQYRDGRAHGAAPMTISQGVRLAIPHMSKEDAVAMFQTYWGMPKARSEGLYDALSASRTGRECHPEDAALAGRFALALDARIHAAFRLAEEQYRAIVRMWAGVAAITLALLFNLGMKMRNPPAHELTPVWAENGLVRVVTLPWELVRWALSPFDDAIHNTGAGYPWLIALLIGAAAVPLAPVAKDLATALSDAMKAWRDIPGKAGAKAD